MLLLQSGGPYSQGLPSEDSGNGSKAGSKTAAGKRNGWPAWAGAAEERGALNLSQGPVLAQDVKPAVVTVEVLRMGEMAALVDTGATKSVVREDLVRGNKFFTIGKCNRNWKTIDTAPANQVGQTSLTVNYQGSSIYLGEVVVMRDLHYPLILGLEWVDAARVSVSTLEREGKVTFLPDSSGLEAKTLEVIMLTKPEESKEELNRYALTPNGPKMNSTQAESPVKKNVASLPIAYKHVPERPYSTLHMELINKLKSPRTTYTIGDVRNRFSGIEETKEVNETLKSEQCYGPEMPFGWLAHIDAIAERREARETYRKPSYLSPLKGQKVGARVKSFINFTTPAGKDGVWFIEAASGTQNGRDWATPSCIVKSDSGVPVINGSTRTLRGRSLKCRLRAEPFNGEAELVDCGPDDKIVGILSQIEPDWYNNPEEVYEPPLDPDLTQEQAAQVRLIFNKHRRLFSKKKGLTHLTEHRIET